MTPYSRRKFLIALGAVGVVALSGCGEKQKPSPKHDPRMDPPSDLPERVSKYGAILRKEVGEDGVVRVYGYSLPPLIYPGNKNPVRKEVLFSESAPVEKLGSLHVAMTFNTIEEAQEYRTKVLQQKTGTPIPYRFNSPEEKTAFIAMVKDIHERKEDALPLTTPQLKANDQDSVIILPKETVEAYQQRLSNIARNTVLDPALFPRRMQDVKLVP